MNRSPDVEAEITLLSTSKGGRSNPTFSGYRPSHAVLDDYLTSGIHHYLDRDQLLPGETALGTITFITPEAYPHCLSAGQIICIREGGRVVGAAKILRVLNPLLKAEP